VTRSSEQRRLRKLSKQREKIEREVRDRLFAEHARAFQDADSPELIEAIRDMPPQLRERASDRYFFASGLLIAHLLGHDVHAVDDPYFQFTRDAEGNTPFHFPVRVTMVAETLFLLRNQQALPEFVRRLRGRDFQSAFYETFAARAMLLDGFEVEARPEINVAREDFDFWATKGGVRLNVEVTRVTPPEYASNTVWSRLNKKCGQLPKTHPTIIFCGCPGAWFEQDPRELAQSLKQDAVRILRANSRVNAIVFFGEVNTPIGDDGFGLLQFPFVYELNEHPAHDMGDALGFFIEPQEDMRRRDYEGQTPEEIVEQIREGREYFAWVDQVLTTR
jgi:hypothetical protein